MIRKKVFMLGAFAVGKTSLVQRFVHTIFSERYLTTIGVKIEKKVLQIDGVDVTLLLWDLHGEDELQKINASYLRGSSGYFIVADGTRAETLEHARSLRRWATDFVQDIPCIYLLNKSDLREDWQATEEDVARLSSDGLPVIQTSAKSGAGVDEAFEELCRSMLESQ